MHAIFANLGSLNSLSPTLVSGKYLQVPTTARTVIPEACYMLNKKFGPVIEIKFLEEIISVNLQIEILKFVDILRIAEILKKYKSLNIGFVDGSIVAIAERLKINQILSLDNKHFSSIIPVGFDYFEILI